MRFKASFALPLFAAMVFTSPAVASDYPTQQERAYADSYGNLVIIGSSGYKRILVGQGNRVRDYAPYVEPGDILYSDPQATYPVAVVCSEPRLYRMAPGQSLHVIADARCGR